MILTRRLLILCTLLAALHTLQAQVKISGRVFDMSQKIPLQSVSVLTNSGAGTVTDSNGHYSIIVPEKDSIWFSYLGKPTPKYSVHYIPNIQNFEIALHVNVTELRQVMVKPRNYHQDSIQNRLEYARAFDFHKPGVSVATSPDGGVGLDIDEFIEMFQFRRNRRMAAFRNRLIREEQEKYIDHRFSRALIIKLTQLRGADLDSFIVRFRPNLAFIQTANEYELQLYIKTSFEKYQRYKSIMGEMKKNDE